LHELSIALSLIDAASEQLPALGPSARIARVHVRVGTWSSVAAEALQLAFDIAKDGSAIESAELAIESCVDSTVLELVALEVVDDVIPGEIHASAASDQNAENRRSPAEHPQRE
jgi:Zn finger protein HypA/HybF involved in hydrogenase expression